MWYIDTAISADVLFFDDIIYFADMIDYTQVQLYYLGDDDAYDVVKQFNHRCTVVDYMTYCVSFYHFAHVDNVADTFVSAIFADNHTILLHSLDVFFWYSSNSCVNVNRSCRFRNSFC